jgi:hypothetical protein
MALLAVGAPLLAIAATMVHRRWPEAPHARWARALTGGVLVLLGVGAEAGGRSRRR